MEEEHHAEHKKEEVHHEKKVKIKKSSMWMMISGVLAVLLIISVTTGGFKGGMTSGKTLSAQEAANNAISYINTNLLQPGTTAELKDVEEADGLYNIKMEIGGTEYDSYVTKDGGLLFPSAVDMTEEIATPETTTPEAPAGLVKSDKPVVELFVMSHCPYGTQAEKGMIPVVELLGNKIDFEVKFVNYVMHGEKEVLEELNQYCIETEQNAKYLDYLKCFLKEGDGAGCLAEVKVDTAKLEACTKKADTEFEITENLKNPSGTYPAFLTHDAECKEYGVRGSPTLIINGAEVSSSRSPAAYLATICGAFNEAPAECDEELSTANPSSGFGYEATGAATAAQCG